MLKFAKLLILVGVATAASATTIQFQTFPSGSNVFFSAYIDGASTAVNLLCDDYVHHTPNNTSIVYTYVKTLGTDPMPWTNVRFDGPYPTTYQTRYRAAAILLAELTGLLAPPAPYIGATPNDYQAAVWELFDYLNRQTVGSTAVGLMNDAYAKAGNSTYASIYNRLTVYTPDAAWVRQTGLDPQEFITLSDVPEPAQGVGLLAALGLGWLVRRRRKA